MSKMKSMLGLYTIAAMAMANNPDRYIQPQESDQEKQQRFANAEIQRNKANGLKEFFYGENSLWALNQNTANKKAKKKNWL